MDIITNPQQYNICFSIASLVLIGVTLIINSLEEAHDNRQKHFFGMIIFDALIVNLAGLFHSLWRYSDWFRGYVMIDMNNSVVLIQKIFSYVLAYLSLLYVMSIFRVEVEMITKKIIVMLPAAFSVCFFLTSLFTDYFFIFNEYGEIQYNYPQGALVNISLIIYFLYAFFLYAKYCRSFSTEKVVALIFYYLLMLAGIPIRIVTRSSSIFEFSVSLALIFCVYTFQNPSEFSDRISGAGTRNALTFAVSNNLLQKKVFTVFGIMIERLDAITGGEPLEIVSDLLGQITAYLRKLCPGGEIYYLDDGSYMMIFPESEPDDPIIEKTAEQVRKRFKEPWKLGDRKIRLFESAFSIGFPDEIDSIDKFNEVRGVIVKAVQRSSRDLMRVSDLNLKHVEHDKKIDSIVKHALDDGLLEVYYQPIYSTAQKKFISCEALLRLRSPQLGFISPAVFMPVAERNGAVIEIDSFVLSSVCRMLSETEAVNLGLEFVEVNLSVVDCIQANLSDNVINTLKKFDVKPDQINLEVTETFEEGITSIMDENIDKLSKHGVSFSMDDFGTGYSNLARISSLPVDIFKLDKSIIQSAFESGTSYMVLMNLIKLIKSLDKKIVAEGVETKEQADQIIRFGCDYIQGFYFAKPMPRDKFLEFLREHNNMD